MKTKDLIRLTNDDVNTIKDKVDIRKFDKRYIALDEFTVELISDDGKARNFYDYKWDWLEGTFTAAIRDMNGKWMANLKNSSEDGWVNITTEVEVVDDYIANQLRVRPNRANGLTVADMISCLFIIINLYLCSLVSVESAVKKTSREVHETPKHKKKGKSVKHKVYLLNEYTLRPSYKDAKTHAPHIFSCPAWGVRGHYRHYKDGRVIFIKPYVKGKKKTDYKGKEYVLSEGKNG